MVELAIALDLENTIMDTNSFLLQKIYEIEGKKYTLEDINHWDFRVIGIDITRYIFLTKEGLKNPEAILPTEPDLDEKLGKIIEMGYEIDILTARQDSEEEIKRWLAYHKIPYRYFRKTNHMGESKLPYLISNYIAAVDDNPNLAEEINEGLNLFLFLYDRPWNRNVREKRNVIRVRNFEEVIQFLKRLKETQYILLYEK